MIRRPSRRASQQVNRRRGFTLVEMLVVAPIVILAIGAFLTVIIGLTGEVLASRASNVLSYNVQDALNRIDQDVKISNSFLATNSVYLDTTPSTALGTAQGYNDDKTAFANVGGASNNSIILNMTATTANPTTAAITAIYLKDRPNPCGSTQDINTPFTYNVIYFTKTDASTGVSSLWRRTVMATTYDNTATTVCAVPFQQPSCSPTYMQANPGATFCKTEDIRLVDGVAAADFVIQYFNDKNSNTVNVPASNAAIPVTTRTTALQSATTVNVSINAKQMAAGRDLERTATVRVSRLNSTDSKIGETMAESAPTTPAPTMQTVAGASATVTWPAVTGANGYTLEYNINGGAWQTRFSNQNTRIATIAANANEDIINTRVTAIGSLGTSGYGTASITIPLWQNLQLQNTWATYSSEYTSAQYTKTKAGVVIVKGLVNRTGGAAIGGELIATLPSGYRPEGGPLLFGTSSTGNSGRVDVSTSGSITIVDGNATWFALDTIQFVPGGRYTRTAMSPYTNGYSNWDAPNWAPGSYVVDSAGRVNLQGLIRIGSPNTDNVHIVDLPAALLPAQYMHIASRSEGFGFFGIDYRAGTSGVVAKASGTNYLALNTMYYPASHTGWANLSMANGWQAYGNIHSTPQYTKSSVDNVVTLKGLLSKPSASVYDQAMAVLPVGSRPKQRILTASVSNGQYTRLDIMPNGEIRSMGGTNNWFSIDGISFKAEQ